MFIGFETVAQITYVNDTLVKEYDNNFSHGEFSVQRNPTPPPPRLGYRKTNPHNRVVPVIFRCTLNGLKIWVGGGGRGG